MACFHMSEATASYIWTESQLSRNATVLFRRNFDLPGDPKSGVIHIFADTRYRLIVNGTTVAHGPCRFKRGFPEYDSHEIRDFLLPGKNLLAILVNSMGAGTFLSDPGPGGLIAWGEFTSGRGRKTRISSDATWKAIDSPGHEPLMNELSFAVGPGEWLDARKMPDGWESPHFDDCNWPAAIEIEDTWGPLKPRSIALLDEREVTFDSPTNTYAARTEPDSDLHSAILDGRRREVTHHITLGFFHSPKKQKVPLTSTGGEFHVNGERLAHEQISDAPARREFIARLEEGWNAVFIVNQTRTDLFEFALRFPKASGISVHRAPNANSAKGFLFLGPLEDRPASLIRKIEQQGIKFEPDLSEWFPTPRGRRKLLPVAERFWDRFHVLPEMRQRRKLDNPKLLEGLGDYSAVAFLLDFKQEVLGRPIIELTAPAGAVLDLAYGERLHDGKLEPWYQGTRMVERYVTKSGRQTFHAIHPRGMRYLEITVRTPRKLLNFHRIGVTRAAYPVEHIGNFRCSDPRLDTIWKLGRDTQEVCMEDAYLDCPWRERGLYTGDLLVQFYTDLACFGDPRMMRKSVELMFQTQGENKLLAPCAHGLAPGRLPDYSAIGVISLWHYWARTGDLSLARSLKTHMLDLLAALRGLETEKSAISNAEPLRPYLDNGIVDHEGLNMPLSAFVYEAHRKAADLLDRIGDKPNAEISGKHAAKMRTAIRREFFDKKTGLFLDRRPADVEEATPSAVGNTLAVLFEIADKRQSTQIVDWVAEKLLDNFLRESPTQRRRYQMSPYFSYFGIELLYRFGRDAEAQAYMRRYWSHMLENGAWACWEFFAPVCSLCHAWSSTPTHHLSTKVLGISYAEDGNPDVIRIQPKPANLRWAEGSYPHPRGPIHVRWELKGDQILLDYAAPEGVTILPPDDN